MIIRNARLFWSAALVVGAGCTSDTAEEKSAVEEPVTTEDPMLEPDSGPAGPDVEVGAIVITELMPNVKSSAIDWLELQNVSGDKIQLEGCILRDDGDEQFTIARPLTLAPGARAVLASAADDADGAPAALAKPAYVFAAGEFQLAAPGPDQVVLECRGVVVDRVAYAAYAPGPATEARGLQLDPAFFDAKKNDAASAWCYASLPVLTEEFLYHGDHVASPGVENPACTVLAYGYNDQADVLVDGIDLEQTMKVVERDFGSLTTTSMMTIWAIRDQVMTPEVAQRIAELYLANIGDIYEADNAGRAYDGNFGVWHFAWSIANLYRNGNDAVRARLQLAYDDALTRPETLKRFKLIAIDHVRGDTMLMGDIHEVGRAYALGHIVAPGNPRYLQSIEDYMP